MKLFFKQDLLFLFCCHYNYSIYKPKSLKETSFGSLFTYIYTSTAAFFGVSWAWAALVSSRSSSGLSGKIAWTGDLTDDSANACYILANILFVLRRFYSGATGMVYKWYRDERWRDWYKEKYKVMVKGKGMEGGS
jgi:hypothetical protein